MRTTINILLILAYFTCLAVAQAEDELGAVSGLNEEITSGGVASPKQPIVNVPSNVRTPIVLPSHQYQPRTIVVPLPNERPVVSPPNAPDTAKAKPIKAKKPKQPNPPTEDEPPAKGETIKTKPLEPIIY